MNPANMSLNNNADKEILSEVCSRLVTEFSQHLNDWHTTLLFKGMEDLEHICAIQNINRNIMYQFTSYNPNHLMALQGFEHPMEYLAHMYQERIGFPIDDRLRAAIEKLKPLDSTTATGEALTHGECMSILDSKIDREYGELREKWAGLTFDEALENTHKFLVAVKAYDCLKNRREQFPAEKLDLLSQREGRFLASNTLWREWQFRADTPELAPLLESVYQEMDYTRPLELKEETMLALRLADGRLIELPVNPYDLPEAPPDIQQITVHTVDKRLNELLQNHAGLLESACSGLKHADYLAYLLSRMDGAQLMEMRKSPQGSDGSIERLLGHAIFHADWQMDRNGRINPNFIRSDSNHHYFHESNLDCNLLCEWEFEIQKNRITGGELFSRVVELARESGDMDAAESILDYILPDEYENVPLTKYGFDFVPQINFGGSEGIYVDCYLFGEFADYGENRLKVGTIKTLKTDLEACKIMGALCGSLMYHESNYVNSHLDLFTPFRELEQRKLASAQAPTADMEGFGGMKLK